MKYIFLDPLDQDNYMVVDTSRNNIYGLTNSLGLLTILINNKIKLYSSRNRNPMILSKEEVRDLLFMNCRFYFNGYKDNEELIDLLCGNDWPNYLQEFIEKTIVPLTKERN